MQSQHRKYSVLQDLPMCMQTYVSLFISNYSNCIERVNLLEPSNIIISSYCISYLFFSLFPNTGLSLMSIPHRQGSSTNVCEDNKEKYQNGVDRERANWEYRQFLKIFRAPRELQSCLKIRQLTQLLLHFSIGSHHSPKQRSPICS